MEHATDRDGWYRDSSGNGNHLSSWEDQTRPSATDDRPFEKIPQTRKKNKLALDFDGAESAGDDLITSSKGGGSDKAIGSFSFKKGWTVECSVKMHSMDRWQVFVGKDNCPGLRGEPVFSLKAMLDNRLQFLFCDDEGMPHWLESITPLVADEWYGVAVTYDKKRVKLYLKRKGDREYFLQDTLDMTAKVSLGKWEGPWTVGRGMWNSAPTDWFHGVVDEVRISDVALKPKEFLAERN